MKTIVEVAGRFFEVRKEWVRLRDSNESRTWQGHRRMHELEQQMTALGWVLDVDLALMNAPKPPSPLGESLRVEVHELPAYGGYLIEIPRNGDAGWKTEDCGFFVSERQARELRSELFKATARYRGDALTQVSRRPSLSDGRAEWAADTLPPGA